MAETPPEQSVTGDLYTANNDLPPRWPMGQKQGMAEARGQVGQGQDQDLETHLYPIPGGSINKASSRSKGWPEPHSDYRLVEHPAESAENRSSFGAHLGPI